MTMSNASTINELETKVESAEPTEKGFGVASYERPVPRISIEAFSEFPDTAEVLERAAADRRLSKSHFGVQTGGIPGAVQYFSTHTTPNLLIVETSEQGNAVLSGLEQLANVCDENTKVIVVGRANDVHLYRELIRRGISEYLVAPLNPLQLIETISGLYSNPKASPVGRVIAFAGARGGAGASTLAHNVAWYVAENMRIETVIVDFDLAFGTAGLNFNQDPSQGVAEALTAPERLDDVLLDRLLLKCGEHLSLFAAPALLDRDYDADPSAYEKVIDQVRNVIPCVIVDLPHAWSPSVRNTILAADEILIVATPDLASLRNAKNMIDLAKARRPNDTPPRLIINQTGVPKRPEIPLKEFAAAVNLEPSFVLPFDPPLFGTAANNGQMLAEVQATARASECVRQIAELVTGRAVPQPSKKGGLSFLPFLAKKAG
jgi:pilus assembly protein CpaE